MFSGDHGNIYLWVQNVHEFTMTVIPLGSSLSLKQLMSECSCTNKVDFKQFDETPIYNYRK